MDSLSTEHRPYTDGPCEYADLNNYYYFQPPFASALSMQTAAQVGTWESQYLNPNRTSNKLAPTFPELRMGYNSLSGSCPMVAQASGNTKSSGCDSNCYHFGASNAYQLR